MVARCSVFIATSLDGFISRTDGSIDWLEQANESVPPGEDCGYSRFISTVDTLVMGSNSYDKVLSFAEWPYGQTPVVVLSSRLTAAGDASGPETVSVVNEAPAALVARLSSQGLRHLYIDGGVTIQSFLAAGLIDEVTITVIPVLIGTGRRLFGPLGPDVRLEHLSTVAFEFGFVQSHYRVAK
jgi:dihydrofolate reductase